eukprot:NODE_8824_length_278_cov_36.454148_g8084_i0.p2 GENE.NODE_8824_length_278_cov_36.454148_g8084_i0~~NODE_8824_length_278_cov_36.454148_g8084_i0.p2  ORF type:complete len:65 (+),score=14.40 NODE_8824_length_278_cov_36.454148_g8084_i0:2-196(+)
MRVEVQRELGRTTHTCAPPPWTSLVALHTNGMDARRAVWVEAGNGAGQVCVCAKTDRWYVDEGR